MTAQKPAPAQPDAVTWLPAHGAPFYEISSDGRVRSISRWYTKGRGKNPRWLEGRERVLHPDEWGYLQINLSLGGGKKKPAKVHVLVCTAFHGPKPSPKHEVRHLNGNSIDNRAENLAWGTRSENAQDLIRHGRNYFLNKTHCKHGHEFTEANTEIRTLKSGRTFRRCRACSRRSCRQQRRKRAEAAK